MNRTLVIRVANRQTRQFDAPRSDVFPLKGKSTGKRLPPKNPGDLPRVDYFQLFEEAFGAKETWHTREEMEMRKYIPIMARKIDDLRERVSDMHRYHRQYKLEATKELKKIPLYKREAWMSPDLTRSLLMEDLQSKGYLTETGELKTLEQLREDAMKLGTHTQAPLPLPAHETPRQEAQPDPRDEPAPSADAEVSTSLTAQQPASPPALEEQEAEPPLVIDPLLSDVHAPTFAPRPSEIDITRRPSAKVPSRAAVISAVAADGHMGRDVDKVWVRYPKGEIQADVDNDGRVVEIKPTHGSEHLYDDPTPRRYGRDGKEIGKEADDTITDREAGKGAEGHSEGVYEDEAAEEEEGEEDEVMARLKKEKKTRRKQKSTLWAHLNEPEVLPGVVVYDTALATLHEVDSEGKALSINEKIKEVEARMTAPETAIDLAGDYPAMPERGPDQMDKYNVAVQKSSLEALEHSDDKLEYLSKRVRSAEITGARFASRLPAPEGQMPFQYPRASKEGVWYSRSTVAGEPGRRVKASHWPSEAVEVPFDVHKAAVRGKGYERIKAANTILELTGKIDDGLEEGGEGERK